MEGQGREALGSAGGCGRTLDGANAVASARYVDASAMDPELGRALWTAAGVCEAAVPLFDGAALCGWLTGGRADRDARGASASKAGLSRPRASSRSAEA